MTTTINTMADFERVHREMHARLQDYIWIRRSNYVVVPPEVQSDLTDSDGYRSAANIRFRIAMAKTVVETLAQIKSLAASSNVFFVTITSEKFAVPCEQAAGSKIRRFRRRFRKALKGMHAVGMIEAGLFTRIGQNLPVSRQLRLVSWHGHALVWGVTEKKLRARLKKCSTGTLICAAKAPFM